MARRLTLCRPHKLCYNKKFLFQESDVDIARCGIVKEGALSDPDLYCSAKPRPVTGQPVG